jgi:hypothetical protein
MHNWRFGGYEFHVPKSMGIIAKPVGDISLTTTDEIDSRLALIELYRDKVTKAMGINKVREGNPSVISMRHNQFPYSPLPATHNDRQSLRKRRNILTVKKSIFKK